MNSSFTLPIRSRAPTLPAAATKGLYDSQTVSSPLKSDLKVKKRALDARKKPKNLENVKPEAS
ncbi:hypothetical protein NW752_006143 [Fusarium irregulare]|nr:hypothetical protein NW752_006143 [Fusarium irregulare]